MLLLHYCLKLSGCFDWESEVMSWFQTCDITTTLYAHPPAEPAGCLRPLYFFFSMTTLWRGCGGKGDWMCSSRKHFTDDADLLWLTGAARGRQFDIHGWGFTSIKTNGSIQRLAVMTCNVLSCLESPILLQEKKKRLAPIPSGLVSLISSKISSGHCRTICH